MDESQYKPGGVISPTQAVDPSAPTPSVQTSEQDSMQPNTQEIAQLVQETHPAFQTDQTNQARTEEPETQTAEQEPEVQATEQEQTPQEPPVVESNPEPTVQADSVEVPVAETAPTEAQPEAPFETQVEQPAQAAEPTQPTQPLPAFMSPAPQEPQSPSMQTSKPKKFSLKLKAVPLVAIVIAVVVLVGGSAGAYFGIVVPNKPENKLLSAVADLASHKSMTATGIIDYTPASGGLGISFTYKLAVNTDKSQFSAGGTLGVNGAQFPYEMRYLDKSMYIKVGGLTGLSKLIPASSTGGVDLSSLVKGADNQWYVIDSSFADSMGVKTSCVTDTSFSLTNSDVSLIKSAYSKHPLFTVKNSASEVVDGTPTTKYIVDPASDAEASAFASDLKNLSVVKKINSCASGAVDSAVNSSKSVVSKDTSTGTIALYVTKNKQLKKLEIVTKDKTSSVKINAVFNFDAVTVTKPDGAKPLQDLYSSILGGALLGSSLGSSTLSTSTESAKDTERHTDITKLAALISEYAANNNGKYPTLNDLNSSAFIAKNFPGVDKEIFKDPIGSSYALVSAQQKGAYAYVTNPATCDNAAKGNCKGFLLSATLDDGSVYQQGN